VTVLYRQTASDDIVRQFRYYLLSAEAPEIALRLRQPVRGTIQSLQSPYPGRDIATRTRCLSLHISSASLRRVFEAAAFGRAYSSCFGTHHSGMILLMRSFRTTGPHCGWNSVAIF